MKKEIGKEQASNTEKKSLIFNVINKKLGVKYKYYDYKNTLRVFLDKKCFTKDENIAIFEKFHENYYEYLDLKLSAAISKLKKADDLIYKELLLNKSFDGTVCTFTLDQKISNLKKAGYLELICDGKSIFRKHCKDVSKAILSIMKIKSTDVLFNGNGVFVNKNLEIGKSTVASFKVSF